MREIFKKLGLIVAWLCLTLLGGCLGTAIAWVSTSMESYGDGLWVAFGGFLGLFVGALGGMVVLVWVEDRLARRRTAP
jgi:hypothetical protein